MSEELSQNESVIPLSPVLGSGQAVKNFRRNRKRSKQAQNLESALEEAPKTVGQPEDILDRIKRLETGKLQESNIISSISLNTKVSPAHLSIDMATYRQSSSKERPHIVDPINLQSENVSFSAASLSHKMDPVSFQTGTGKEITISDSKIQNSRKLFEDIWSPHNSKPREQKHNYLHKNAFVPPVKSVSLRGKNVFEGEDFTDLNSKETVCFQPASMKVTHLLSAKKNPSFNNNNNNIFKDETFSDLVMSEKVSFIPASSSLLNSNKLNVKQEISFKPALSRQVISRPQSKSSNLLTRKGPRNIFADEDFEDLKLNCGQFKKARNIFEGEDFSDLNLSFGQFKGMSNYSSNKLSKSRKNIFEGENFDNLNLNGLGFLKSTHNSFQSTPNKNTPQNSIVFFHGFTYKDQQFSQKLALQFAEVISNMPSRSLSAFKPTSRKRKYSEVISDHNSLSLNMSSSNSVTPLQSSLSKRFKKRLGCPFSPTITVSETGLKRAKLMFEDLEPRPTNVTSTPVKFHGDLAKPLSCDLTPIPVLKKNLVSSFSKQSLDVTLTSNNNNRFSLHKPSHGDVSMWLENLTHKRRLLEEQLKIIDEKQKILTQQKNIMEVSGKSSKRALPGVLYRAKSSHYKVHLRDYMFQTYNDNSVISEINPQNAHLVHFNICDKRLTHIETQDGAIIVPTTDPPRIGFSEIEHSFQLMKGVDPNLIPRGWIRNHYRWIIWKLASYERMFVDQFEGCLCVENVIQQLKYRYDVEIDNANRPMLRKIFEKDDCSERRMILCVSNIIKTNNSYELELTDGWYPIRTLIDQPLCHQITKGKIQLGVKLIVYGAKLMNCEGCHPLESSDSVYLKINYNCTRRALWWCKLGYQKASGSFQVPISSVNMEGGKVGCIRCFISRMYPVKYLEKCGDKNVWRNGRAEKRREQEFYNEKFSVRDRSTNYKDLKGINDPVILYDIMQKSDDAEALQEILSVTQKTALYNYSMNKSTNRCPARSVTPVLKLKIVDASCNSDKVYDFHIWRPGEEHLQELKEGLIVSIINVSCSPKWGLSASQSTQFRREAKANDERFLKFRRKVTKIGFLKQIIGVNDEFDTVGLVIEKRVDATQQVCWLSDYKQNLLVIKIHDSPKNILALDMVNEGQIISVCNLMLKHCQKTHSHATGDHSVVFARYSQHRHLQDGLEKLEEAFLNVERSLFIKDCQSRIQQIDSKWEPELEVDEMECSQLTMTDRALLECVEKSGITQ